MDTLIFSYFFVYKAAVPTTRLRLRYFLHPIPNENLSSNHLLPRVNSVSSNVDVLRPPKHKNFEHSRTTQGHSTTMSSEATVNGGPKSRAAMLEEQHALDEAHKATVEDVVDEEDIAHPPPSAAPLVTESTPNAPSQAPTPPAAHAPTNSKSASGKTPTLDVQSEELFPALGSGPKPKAPATSAWGAKGPSAAAALANGAPSGASPGKATPSFNHSSQLRWYLFGSKPMVLIFNQQVSLES